MAKTMLTQLTELIETHNVFVRERKPNQLRAMGIALLYFGMSCRKTAEVLSFFDEASYEAARQWYHRAQNMLSAPQKRYRSTMAIDETKVKEGEGDVVLPLGGGRYREQRAAWRLAHADTRRPRCFPFHTTGVTDVHERTHRRCS